MSRITDVILTANFHDHDTFTRCIEEANTYFGNTKERLVSIHHWKIPEHVFEPSYSLQCDIAIGAFNYLDANKFAFHLALKVNWPDEDKHTVQLMLKEERDFEPECFRSIMLFADRYWKEGLRLSEPLDAEGYRKTNYHRQPQSPGFDITSL